MTRADPTDPSSTLRAVSRRPDAAPVLTSGARNLLLLLTALGGASIVATLGLSGHPAAREIGGYLCAAVALVGGLGYAVSRADGPGETRSRAFIGIGVALSSVQVMMGVTGGPLSTVYHPWDTILSLAILAFVAGGVHRPDRLLGWVGAGRLLTELAMLGTAVAAAFWQVGFTGLPLSMEDAFSVVALLFIGGYLLCMAGMTFALGYDRGFTLATLAAAGLVVSAVVNAYTFIIEGDPGWLGQAVSCLCWPAVVAGIFHARSQPQADPALAQAQTEARSFTVLACAMLLPTLGMLALVARGTRIDRVTLWLGVGFLISLGVRELLRAWHAAMLFERLAGQAQVDALTGLANLRALDERLAALELRRTSQPLSVLTVDLDRFKDVNDVLGREVGDELLRVFSAELRRLGDVGGGEPFRTGGDEFVLLCSSGPQGAMLLAEDVRRASEVANSLVSGVKRVPVGASIGVAHVTRRSRVAPPDVRQTLTQSNQAMRQAKSKGGGVALFDEPLATSHARTRMVEDHLRRRLQEGLGVEVHFQPVVRLSTHAIAGVEALARWTDDTLGAVPPAEFIQVAEDGGLMVELGEHIFYAALTSAVDAGLIAGGRWVAVNVSPLQLRARGFAASVAEVLGRTGVPPRQLVIEVTESVFVRHDDPAVATLTELAALGVRVSLDDFGTGYSSLAYLTRLPVRGLKIDRSITRTLEDPKTTAIVVSIVEMARRLDLDVVVEGVETLAQERRARSLGLELVQGLLYSPALSLPDLAELLTRRSQLLQSATELSTTSPEDASTQAQVATPPSEPRLRMLHTQPAGVADVRPLLGSAVTVDD